MSQIYGIDHSPAMNVEKGVKNKTFSPPWRFLDDILYDLRKNKMPNSCSVFWCWQAGKGKDLSLNRYV